MKAVHVTGPEELKGIFTQVYRKCTKDEGLSHIYIMLFLYGQNISITIVITQMQSKH